MMPFYSHAYLKHLAAGERERVLASHLPLGYHPTTHDTLLLPEGDRFAGMYLLGVQGVGKSGLLENLIDHDARVGNAVIVIDPHGDLTAHCLAELPEERIHHTYVLDMEDEGYPFGVNVFASGKLETSIQHAQAVERIMHVFEVLWEDVLSQQHLPRYVRAATITFLANPGATLVDMQSFLLDDAIRQRMLAPVADPTVRQFWKTQYDDLSPVEQTRRIQPLINRLEALFMGRSLVRNIVGQQRTSISFRKAIENRELVFIKLPIKTVAQDARLIGTIIVSQLQAALFSFADMPEKDRPGFSLYVDEFQHFSTPDFAALFTEGRKFGVKVSVAHQYRGQLPKYLQDSTMTARTKVCFQTTPEDGREMAHLFPAQSERILPEDMNPHPVEYLLTHGSDNLYVDELLEVYVRPLAHFKRGGRVEISHGGTGAIDLVTDMASGGRTEHVRVADPTPYLDTLFLQVMKSGSTNTSISRDIVRGFANSGVGFFPQVRNISPSDKRLSPQVTYPAFIVDIGNGPVPMRAPESGSEQLYHCILCIRKTMAFLAEHPIGKTSAPNTSAVAQMLTHLPRRAAFVRSGEDVGVIYTNQTPQRMSGNQFQERLSRIREQTRVKYCHPRSEIEHLFMGGSGGSRGETPTPVEPAESAEPDAAPSSPTGQARPVSEGEIKIRHASDLSDLSDASDVLDPADVSNTLNAQDTPPQRWEEVGDE